MLVLLWFNQVVMAASDITTTFSSFLLNCSAAATALLFGRKCGKLLFGRKCGKLLFAAFLQAMQVTNLPVQRATDNVVLVVHNSYIGSGYQHADVGTTWRILPSETALN
ncbi:hypothetical protein ABBQ32_010193 [Trebouxia sp. C0010 RCD-2024]